MFLQHDMTPLDPLVLKNEERERQRNRSFSMPSSEHGLHQSKYEPPSRKESASYIRSTRDSLGVRQDLAGKFLNRTTIERPPEPIRPSIGLNSVLFGEQTPRLPRGASASSKLSSSSGIKELLFGSYSPEQLKENERKRAELIQFYEESKRDRAAREAQKASEKLKDQEAPSHYFLDKHPGTARARLNRNPISEEELAKRINMKRDIEQQIQDKRENEARVRESDSILDKKLLSDNPFLRASSAVTSSARHKSYLEPHHRESPESISNLAKALDVQLQERAEAREAEKLHYRKAEPEIQRFGKPGAGAPLADKDGNRVTHLHHVISGFLEPDYETTHLIRDQYKEVLDKQLQIKSVSAMDISENPTRLEPIGNIDTMPRMIHEPSDIMPKRNHTAYSTIHSKATNEYFEFGTPGGGAPRLATGNTKGNIETHIPASTNPRRVDPNAAKSYAKALDEIKDQKKVLQEEMKRNERKYDEQMKEYNPYGKPGSGAPNPRLERQDLPPAKDPISIAQIWDMGKRQEFPTGRAVHVSTDIMLNSPVTANEFHRTIDRQQASAYGQELSAMASEKRHKESIEHEIASQFHNEMIVNPQGVLRIGDRTADQQNMQLKQELPDDAHYPWAQLGKRTSGRTHTTHAFPQPRPVINPVNHRVSQINYSRRPTMRKPEQFSEKVTRTAPPQVYRPQNSQAYSGPQSSNSYDPGSSYAAKFMNKKQ